MVVQTVASLRKSLKKMGITGYSGLNKAQLMRKIGSPKKTSTKKRSATVYVALRRKRSSRRGSRSRRSGSRRRGSRSQRRGSPITVTRRNGRVTYWRNGWPYTPLAN